MAERFDLDAIEADDALLDLLAAGGESAWEAGQHDPALMLLADLRLAVEVEDELPVETIDDPESFLARCAALNPVTDPFARKMAARGFALGVAAVAALSVSGVAAAVNGNPLAPYESVIEKVVDGLRPESSSYPKDELDGLTVLDKSKIVKVGKDFEKKQKAKQDAEVEKRTNPFGIGSDTEATGIAMPPLARPKPPQVEKPTTTKVDDTPPKPVERKSDEEKPVVDEPTPEPTSQPTDTPTTPTDTPTTPTDTPTTPTEPTETTTTPPPNEEGSDGNGSTGDPSGPPTAVPSTGDGGVQTGEGAGDTGTQTGDDKGTTTESGTGDADSNGADSTGAADSGAADSSSADSTGAADNGAADPGSADSASGSGSADSKPVELPNVPVADEPAEVKPVLPTPTGEPILPNRLEQYVGKALEANAKHSSGKPSLGYANGKYAKGKHSSGAYVEGKHAAFDRANGSMAPVTLRQILRVLNTPMTGN